MRIEADKRLFTTDDFSRMHEAGIFNNDERVELVEGEIIKLNPGRRHVAITMRMTQLFIEAFARRACVHVQGPLVLDMYNEPKPDIVALKPRLDFYANVEPSPEHTLFIVEISDTTLARDSRQKLARYAQYGVPEYWIADLKHDLIHVYRNPSGNEYRTFLAFRRGDSISPLAFPDVSFKVEDLLG